LRNQPAIGISFAGFAFHKNLKDVTMRAGPVAAIILSLIVPAGLYSLHEAGPYVQEARIDSSNRLLATKHAQGDFKKNQPENSSLRWYKRKNATALRGVALVIHGLNGRPDKMKSIIAELTACGIDCLNLSLRGHGENYFPLQGTDSVEARMEAFKSVSYPLWKAEVDQAYKHAKKSSNLYDIPLYLVGFSMGGLLGVDLFTSKPDVMFDKMVLFAPALKMHKRNYLLRLLSPFPKLVVPGMAHRSYLANKGTPMAAYDALFEASTHFEKNLDPKINVPTVVFIDKQDELITSSGLQKMIQRQNLDQWKLHVVKKDQAVTEIKMHHLIIDEASVGNEMWQEIVDTTITHLVNGSSGCPPEN
jgi:alpha-beta hydrolase superfamily lysophospholipase